MKVSLPTGEEFCVRDCVIANTECKLVFSIKHDIKWNDENKVFRSSIWTKDGELISASWKKFTNLGEQLEFEPLDIDSDIEFIHKLDGSTLIISKFKGELIVRTRGTHDASILNNGNEIPFLKQKYPSIFDNDILNSEEYSIVCEWYSPKNVIVEREAEEPTLWLTGIIKHDDYSYLLQKDLDAFALEWKIQRPARYQFNSLPSMIESVNQWKKGEGIVIYGNNGQILKKTKSDRYLILHRIKSTLSNEKNLIEFYIDKEMPSCEAFSKIIETEFDYEIAVQLKSEIEKICEAGEKARKYIDHILEVVHDIRMVETRKEQALMIKKNFKENSALVFCVLDNKEITKEQRAKLINQNYESQRAN
jgi:hypothetical protein